MDSAKKIVAHIAAVSKVDLRIKGEVLTRPRKVVISKLFWRRFDCLPDCGGCCLGWTLDYLPKEWIQATRATDGLAGLGSLMDLEVNGELRQIMRVRPAQGRWCRFFDGNGCSIYQGRPLSCRIPLMTIRRIDGDGYLWKGPYSRHWLMKGVDGGAIRCEIGEYERAQLLERDLPVLKRLQDWAEHWGVDTWLPEIRESLQALAAWGQPIRLEFHNEE